MDSDTRIKLMLGDLIVRLCISEAKREQQDIAIANFNAPQKPEEKKDEQKT